MGLALSPKDFFKYCPRCGRSYDSNSLETNNLDCKKCGFVFYHNPKTAVNALIISKDNNLLLVKRAHDPAKGAWDLPGGFVDWGEDPATGLQREMKEELGVDFEVLKLFSACHAWYPFDGLEVSLNIFVYTGCIPEGADLKAGDDVNGYRWFPLIHLPPDIAFPGIADICQELKKEYKIGFAA